MADERDTAYIQHLPRVLLGGRERRELKKEEEEETGKGEDRRCRRDLVGIERRKGPVLYKGTMEQ